MPRVCFRADPHFPATSSTLLHTRKQPFLYLFYFFFIILSLILARRILLIPTNASPIVFTQGKVLKQEKEKQEK